MSQAGERVIEVLGAFLRLGLRSFGGPMAHFGYFRAEFVARRGWLDESAFARLLALCQFLPGPASSQLRVHIRSHSRRAKAGDVYRSFGIGAWPSSGSGNL